MQIRVRTEEGQNIWVPLPTGLIFNRLTASIAARAAGKYGPPIRPAQLARLFAELRRFKRRHPDWVLVEVDSAEGDHVRIKL